MLWAAVAVQPGITMEDLIHEETRYKKISALLAYELEATCPVLLERRVRQINGLLTADGRKLNGRQVALMIKNTLGFNDNMSGTCSIKYFIETKLLGDNKMERFAETWNWFLERMQNGVVTELGLRDQLYELMKGSKALECEIKAYEHALEGSDEKSYDYLTASIIRHVEKTSRKSHESHKDAFTKHLKDGNDTQQVKLMSEVKDKDPANAALRVAKTQPDLTAKALAAVIGKQPAAAVAGN